MNIMSNFDQYQQHFPPSSNQTLPYAQNRNQQEPYFEPSRTLFLGDLSFFCSEDDLCALFQRYGPITAVRVRRGVTGESLLHGFIAFQSSEATYLAVRDLDGKEFMGRNMRVQLGTSVHQPNLDRDKYVQLHVSFISKQLNFLVNESIFREIFQPYGDIADVTIKRHSKVLKQRRQTGYGFVYYYDVEAGLSAIRALKHATVRDITFDISISYKSGQIRPADGPPSVNNASYGQPPQSGNFRREHAPAAVNSYLAQRPRPPLYSVPNAPNYGRMDAPLNPRPEFSSYFNGGQNQSRQNFLPPAQPFNRSFESSYDRFPPYSNEGGRFRESYASDFGNEDPYLERSSRFQPQQSSTSPLYEGDFSNVGPYPHGNERPNSGRLQGNMNPYEFQQQTQPNVRGYGERLPVSHSSSSSLNGTNYSMSSYDGGNIIPLENNNTPHSQSLPSNYQTTSTYGESSYRPDSGREFMNNTSKQSNFMVEGEEGAYYQASYRQLKPIGSPLSSSNTLIPSFADLSLNSGAVPSSSPPDYSHFATSELSIPRAENSPSSSYQSYQRSHLPSSEEDHFSGNGKNIVQQQKHYNHQYLPASYASSSPSSLQFPSSIPEDQNSYNSHQFNAPINDTKLCTYTEISNHMNDIAETNETKKDEN